MLREPQIRLPRSRTRAKPITFKTKKTMDSCFIIVRTHQQGITVLRLLYDHSGFSGALNAAEATGSPAL